MIKTLIAILLLSSTVYGKDWYVSATGNDSNSGTVEAPFLTIPKCEAAMVDGDTCYVRSGTYNVTDPEPVVVGQKTIAQYGAEPVMLRMPNNTVVPFTGAVTTWDSPDLTLAAMMSVSRFGSMYIPNSLVAVELYVGGVLVRTDIGPALPRILDYSFRSRGNQRTAIQVRVRMSE